MCHMAAFISKSGILIEEAQIFKNVKLPPQSFLFPIKLMSYIDTVDSHSIQYHLVCYRSLSF